METDKTRMILKRSPAQLLMQGLGRFLLAVHCFLFIWAIGGTLEMVMTEVPWKPLTNSDFPDWLLVVHWGSVLFASVIFIVGFFTHWKRTPRLLLLAYGLMSLVCVVETFGYMTSESKYLAMAAEFLAYATILHLLFKTDYFIQFFKKRVSADS